MTSFLRFLKNWTLPVAMLAGVAGYFIYASIPALRGTHSFVMHSIAVIQPALIFAMLFITFCKTDPRTLRLRRWHGWLLLFQALSFAALSLLIILSGKSLPSGAQVIVEGAMLCLICPTATAGAVVTAKLGGDAAGLTTYTILINLTAATVIPVFVPLIHPHAGLGFLSSFLLIIGKVFPLLICPFLTALLVRRFLPGLQKIVLGCKDLAFYLWAVALSIAIAVTVRSIVHTEVAFVYQAGIAAISLLCCVLQFYLGQHIGRRYGSPIGGGQSLGQKNTVFAIWLGYTFLTPVTAIAGGFYSVWHNVFNSWQLYKQRTAENAPSDKS